MAESWYVEHIYLEEQVVPGKRLGRQVRHDSRNRAYAYNRRLRDLTTQLWARSLPILDQGDLGSCTGNMMVGALGTDPIVQTLPIGHPVLNESFAVTIYSGAEKLDGGQGYPPEDEGSSGPSVAQVTKTMGLISGYTHGFSLTDLLDALEDGPLGIGANWYDSMDSPDSTGLVTISPNAYVRGGHEFLCRGKDVNKKLIFCDNSWSSDWGNNGSFSMSWDTATRLLAEQGDVTVPVPLSAPAPTPTPTPVPTPTPTPTPPGPDAHDRTLYRQTFPWTQEHHVGQNHAVANDLKAWYRAKGF